jgi:hypothetical protein
LSLLRFLRVLRAQWPVIAFVALLGAGAALAAAELRNRNLEARFEGVAPISVLQLADEPEESYSRRLDTALAQARSSVAEQLAEDERLTVTSDSSLGAVQFAAMAPTPDEALTAAIGLRASYLAVRPADIAEDQLAPLLDSLATEIASIEADLRALGGNETDPVVEAQRSALLSQLESAAMDAVALDARLLDQSVPDEERADLEAQLAAAEAVLSSIGPRLDALPASSAAMSDTETRLEALVLEQRRRELESQYVSAALRRAEGGVEGLVGEPSVRDRSNRPVSPVLALLAGLIAGSLLGVVAVAASDRVRQPVRTVDDIPGMALLEVSQRSRRLPAAVDWYQAAADDSRRAQIQALRARLERLLDQRSVVLVGGIEAPPRDVTDFALDLASAIGATGRTVLFMDTQLGQAAPRAEGEEAAPSLVEILLDNDRTMAERLFIKRLLPDRSKVAGEVDLAAWAEAGPSLADMLSADDGTVPERSVVKRLLWDRSEVAPNLIVVPAGTLAQDPIDALAGLGFAMVVEEARELVNVVVLSGGDMRNPASEAVVGRARVAVLVARKDHTHMSYLTATAANLDQLGVMIGAGALLVGRSAGRPSRRPQQWAIKRGSAQHDRSARHVRSGQ